MANAIVNFRFSCPIGRYSPISFEKSDSELKEISMSEVSWHDNRQDCWIVVYDRVFDITSFINEHEGGDEVLLDQAGRDATTAFRGAGHGPAIYKRLEKYLIGELPVNERLFRKPGGIKLSGMPE